MSVVIVSGAAGLVGSEAVRYFAEIGMDVLGIDNDLRAYFFGPHASTAWNRNRLEASVPRYCHHQIDIRDENAVRNLFACYGSSIELIIHAAAQPSHDWAAREPLVDFDVNARGTLVLLEAARTSCPRAAFIYMSTNKVYGDRPNRLPLVERETRWEVADNHRYAAGIDESMSVDGCLHSLFGVSKLAGDIAVQEYGRYFGMPTVCFRGGCLTGAAHSGAELHGFLAWLMHCAVARRPYTIFGYAGKQVRDNLDSYDLVRAFDAFRRYPRPGEIYNIGGARVSNCSMREAIAVCEQISGNEMKVVYSDQARTGDHIWWISDVGKFQRDYPEWRITRGVRDILMEIHGAQLERLRPDRGL